MKDTCFFYKPILTLAKTNLKVKSFLLGNLSDRLLRAAFKKQHINERMAQMVTDIQGRWEWEFESGNTHVLPQSFHRSVLLLMSWQRDWGNMCFSSSSTCSSERELGTDNHAQNIRTSVQGSWTCGQCGPWAPTSYLWVLLSLRQVEGSSEDPQKTIQCKRI